MYIDGNGVRHPEENCLYTPDDRRRMALGNVKDKGVSNQLANVLVSLTTSVPTASERDSAARCVELVMKLIKARKNFKRGTTTHNLFKIADEAVERFG